MYLNPEQILKIQRQSMETVQKLAMASLTSVEKLTRLNVETARQSLETVMGQTSPLFTQRQAPSLAATLSDSIEPGTEKLTHYVRELVQIGQETSDEFGRIVEQQMAERQRQTHAALDELAKQVPTGSEGVLSLLRSAVTAAGTAMDQVQKSSRQMATLAEKQTSEVVDMATQQAQKLSSQSTALLARVTDVKDAIPAMVVAEKANGKAADMSDPHAAARRQSQKPGAVA